jgi:FixJ family two-component response regulator
MSRAASGEAAWVAVLDDDASVRTAIARVLRSEGIPVTTYATASDYLEACATSPPACAVVDVHLGGMSGFELQDHLTATRQDIPFIFITAHDDVPSAELARRSGRTGYLRKPFGSEALIAIVRRELQRVSLADG